MHVPVVSGPVVARWVPSGRHSCRPIEQARRAALERRWAPRHSDTGAVVLSEETGRTALRPRDAQPERVIADGAAAVARLSRALGESEAESARRWRAPGLPSSSAARTMGLTTPVSRSRRKVRRQRVAVSPRLVNRAYMETERFDLPPMLTGRADCSPAPSAGLTILARITCSFAALSLALILAGFVLDDPRFLVDGSLVLLVFPPFLLVVLAALPWGVESCALCRDGGLDRLSARSHPADPASHGVTACC